MVHGAYNMVGSFFCMIAFLLAWCFCGLLFIFFFSGLKVRWRWCWCWVGDGWDSSLAEVRFFFKKEILYTYNN